LFNNKTEIPLLAQLLLNAKELKEYWFFSANLEDHKTNE
jgi:hypothetical protein